MALERLRRLVSLLVAWCLMFGFVGRCVAIAGYWEEQDSGVTTELFGLCFVSEDEGWAVGAEGVILHTMDGGETWARHTAGTEQDLHSVAFATSDEGWVVGQNVLLHTMDRGDTWTDLVGGRFGGRTFEFRDLALVDPLNGWISEETGYVWALRDGALSSHASRQLGWMRMSDVDALDANRAWCAGGRPEGEGRVYFTVNGGEGWPHTRFDLPVHAVHFVNAQEGWIVGDRGVVFHSVDGGESWERQESGTDFTALNDVFFVDDREGWAVGNSGLILNTFDGGNTWFRLLWNHPLPDPERPGEYKDFHPELHRVVFVGPLEGWTVGELGIILHFAGEYETITVFPDTTEGEPTLPVRRGRVVLGRDGHSWRTSGTRSNLRVEAGLLHPVRLDPHKELIPEVRSEGRIWSTVPSAFSTPVENLIDDEGMDNCTLYTAWELSGSATVYLDLAARYPVYLLTLRLAPNAHAYYSLPQHLEIGLNDGDPKDLDPRGRPLLHPVWSEEIDGYTPLWIEIPPQSARYIGITVSETERLRLRDLKVFGDGYLPYSTFLSKPIDFDAPSVWGKLRWEAERPPGTELIIRTRSGDDDDPNVYWRRIGESETYTDRTVSGEPMTRYDYDALPAYRRGEITFDSAHWTRWSARYPFEEEEAPVQSADARRYLQIQVDFENAVDAAGTLSSLSVEASSPASSYVVLGEIVPSHTEPARITTFTYGIRPQFRKGDIGFDTVEIHTPVRPVGIHGVLVDSVEMAFTFEITDDPSGLVVRFPELGFLEYNAVVEISFDCAVFRYGSGFPGYIRNSRYAEGLPQRVVAGDALEGVGEDVLTVQTELETPLLLHLDADPDPFTPNGDGTNDETELLCTILKLFAPGSVRVDVYDLDGRLIRHVYEGAEGDGRHGHRWDGRSDDGEVVPPGIYVYRVELVADADRQTRVGVVHVAY